MVTVRAATPLDAEAMSRVHVASWQAAYRHAAPAEVLDAMTAEDRLPWWRGRLAQPPSVADHVLVAEVDGQVVGLAACRPFTGHDDPLAVAGPTGGAGAADAAGAAGGRGPIGSVQVAELVQLYVDPGVFGAGAGPALHAAVLERLRADGCTSVVLDVEVGNVRARRFYEREGWHVVEGTERDLPAWGIALRVVDLRLDL